MTSLKLINIYLDGFRACHYHDVPRSECPYPVESTEAEHWYKGYDYAENLNKVLAATIHDGIII